MADSDKAGLRQMMPSLFNGIATAIAAAAGLIGVLHQTGYLGNHHPRLHAGIEARSADADARRDPARGGRFAGCRFAAYRRARRIPRPRQHCTTPRT